jgi:hypothetical protein
LRQVPTSLDEYDDAILTAFGDALGPSVVERYALTQFSNNAAAAYVQARSDAQVRAQLPQCARRVSRPPHVVVVMCSQPVGVDAAVKGSVWLYPPPDALSFSPVEAKLTVVRVRA